MKKAIFVSMLGLVFLLPFNAKCAKSGICGETAEACSYSLDDEGNLSIIGNGQMADYDYAGAPWGTSEVKKVQISGITKIGEHAFVNTQITSINIPDSVVAMGGWIFEGASQLSDVSLPSNLSYINYGVFSGTGVKKLVLPDSLFQEGAFLSPYILQDLRDVKLVCSAEKQAECEAYVADSQEFYHNPPDYWLTRPYSDKENTKVLAYSTDDEGNILFANKKYASFSDFAKGKYIPKRIYNVDEANAVSGKKNKVMIRYK